MEDKNIQEEVIEGNKILAEFEGYKYYNDFYSQDFNEFSFEEKLYFWSKTEPRIKYEEEGYKYLDYDWYRVNIDNIKWSLNYHTDYNDLMRVWFKFDSIDISKLDLCYRDKLMGFKGGFIVCLTHKSINEAFNKLLKGILYYSSIKHLIK